MSTTIKDSSPVPTQYIALPDEQAANKIIRNYTLAAAASGFVPFSVLSAAGVTATQVFMIRSLCQLYQVPFKENQAQVLLNSALGSAATRLIGIAATAVPGVRTPMRGLSGAAIASLYTATVGEFYKMHFQKGGTLDTASIKDFGNYLVEEFQQGDISLQQLANPMSTLKEVVTN
ncbi:MAG: DUF697 domain-containing protein [Bacteroidota bacterium]